jgi:hypothetical protein
MIPSHLKNKIPVPRQVLESQLQMYLAQADLHRAMLDGHIEEATTWRRMMNAFMKSQGFQGPEVQGWNIAHQAKAKAQEDLLRVAVAQANSQVEIHKAMLEEGQNKIAVPTDFKI